MGRRNRDLAVRVVIGVAGLGMVCPPGFAREAKLDIQPQKVSAEAGKYALLPPVEVLTDGDAVPLYEKAAKALPGKAIDSQIQQWLRLPAEELPVDEAEKALTQYAESLNCVTQAVRCRQCTWPAWTPGTQVANVEEYRRLVFALRLRARLELSKNQYDRALLTVQTGFGMARQLGQAPTVIQLQIGVAAAAIQCREIEVLMQREGTPNLYSSLASLPKPFLEVEKVIDSERAAAASSGLLGRWVSKQAQNVTQPAYDRTRILGKRLDSDLALLQCVEAIRSYAASHGGQLPQTLNEITEVPVPKDPLCGEAFRYTCAGTTAVLESTVPPGGQKSDEVRYQITVKN